VKVADPIPRRVRQWQAAKRRASAPQHLQRTGGLRARDVALRVLHLFQPCSVAEIASHQHVCGGVFTEGTFRVTLSEMRQDGLVRPTARGWRVAEAVA